VRFLSRSADAKASPQSIARIDRTARKVDICRTYVRAVLSIVYRPPWDGYRPLSKVPPAYRPRRNVAICSSFVLDLTLAVDAVATLPAFSYVLLIAPRVSFCRNDASSKRLHPSLQGRRRKPRPLPCTDLPSRRRSRRSRGCLLQTPQQPWWLKSLLMIDEDCDTNVFRSTQTPLKRCIL